MLAQEHRLKSLEVLRRLRERGNGGGKSTVFALMRKLRVRPVGPICRFEGLAGEFSQHDFGEVLVEWTGGGRTRVHFFASRLKYSRYALVTLVRDQRLETLVRTLAAHFVGFGGAAAAGCVRSSAGHRDEIGPEDRRGAGLEPDLRGGDGPAGRGGGSLLAVLGPPKGCFGESGGLGEGLVLQDPALPGPGGPLDPIAGLARASQRAASHSRATERVPADLLPEEDLGRLRPVKLAPEQLDLRYPVRVGPTGMVTFETNRYSMPAEALGYAATLHLYADRVVIVAGRYRPEHPRLHGRHQVASRTSYRDSLLAAVSGKRWRMYLKRRQLLELGPAAERVLTELVHVRPRQWPDDVERVRELLQACGSDALRGALQQAARLPSGSSIPAQPAAHRPRRSRRRTFGPVRAAGEEPALCVPQADGTGNAPLPHEAKRVHCFAGPSSRGKTHLAIAIACKAIQNGFDARFATVADLIDDLSAASREGRFRAALKGYVQPAVLAATNSAISPTVPTPPMCSTMSSTPDASSGARCCSPPTSRSGTGVPPCTTTISPRRLATASSTAVASWPWKGRPCAPAIWRESTMNAERLA